MSSNVYSYSTEEYIFNITNINSEFINIVVINKSNMKIINETITKIQSDNMYGIFSIDNFYDILKTNIMSIVDDRIIFNYSIIKPEKSERLNLKTIKFENAIIVKGLLSYYKHIETDLEVKTRIENMMKEKDNKIKELEDKMRTNEDIERLMKEKEDIKMMMEEKDEKIKYLEEKIKMNIEEERGRSKERKRSK
jgi:hypothetical protein